MRIFYFYFFLYFLTPKICRRKVYYPTQGLKKNFRRKNKEFLIKLAKIFYAFLFFWTSTFITSWPNDLALAKE